MRACMRVYVCVCVGGGGHTALTVHACTAFCCAGVQTSPVRLSAVVSAGACRGCQPTAQQLLHAACASLCACPFAARHAELQARLNGLATGGTRARCGSRTQRCGQGVATRQVGLQTCRYSSPDSQGLSTAYGCKRRHHAHGHALQRRTELLGVQLRKRGGCGAQNARNTFHV